MEKMNVILELNKLKGLSQEQQACHNANCEIKGVHVPGNPFLPKAKPAMSGADVQRLRRLTGRTVIPGRSAHWSEAKGHDWLPKLPSLSRERMINVLVGNWWKNDAI